MCFNACEARGFIATLVPAAYLAYTVHAGYWTMRHGDYAAEPSAAYVATMMALLSSTILSLVGFYFVKSAIDVDRRTGVGQILAATPLPGWLYLAAKATSNFVVLTSMVAVTAAAALWLAPTSAYEPAWGPLEILVAFALLALPFMALTAAAAVFFEAAPWLRGGLGNVIWFFLWGFVLMASLGDSLDPSGMALVRESLVASLQAAVPAVDTSYMSLSAGPQRELLYFSWSGLAWSPPMLGSRLVWFGIAALLALSAVTTFDRFDPGRQRRRREKREPAASESTDTRDAAPQMGELVDRLLAPATHVSPAGSLLRLAMLELRMMVIGQPGIWYAGVLALLGAQLFAPLGIVRETVLTFAFIWPLLVWSGMGSRDRQLGTEELVSSAPQPVLRQMPAVWLAGWMVGLGLTLPALARFGIAGEWGGPRRAGARLHGSAIPRARCRHMERQRAALRGSLPAAVVRRRAQSPAGDGLRRSDGSRGWRGACPDTSPGWDLLLRLPQRSSAPSHGEATRQSVVRDSPTT